MTISFDSLKFGGEPYRNPFLVKGHICKSDKPRYYKRDKAGRFSRVDSPKASEKKNLYEMRADGLSDVELFKPKSKRKPDEDYENLVGELEVYAEDKDPTGRTFNEISWINVNEKHRKKGIASELMKVWEEINDRKLVHSTALTQYGQKLAGHDTKRKRLIQIVTPHDSEMNATWRARYVVNNEEYKRLNALMKEQTALYDTLRDQYWNQIEQKIVQAELKTTQPLRDYLHSESRDIKSAPTALTVPTEVDVKAELASLSRELDDFDTFLAARATYFNAGRNNPITPEQAEKCSYSEDWKRQYPELLEVNSSRQKLDDVNRSDYALAKRDDKKRNVALVAGGALVGTAGTAGGVEAYRRRKVKHIKGNAKKGAAVLGGATVLAGGAALARKAVKATKRDIWADDPHPGRPPQDSLAYDLIRGGMGIQKNWKEEIARNTWI